MTGTAVPAFADVYDIRKGSITIVANGDGTAKVTQNETVNDKDDDVKVTGSNEVTGNTVDIINNTDDDLKVTLSDVTITDTKGDAAVSVSGTGDTTIELDGSNTLESSGWHAGLERNEEKDSAGNVVSGKLTIQDEDKNGSLDATGGYGGAGIGGYGNATVTITGDAVIEEATGGGGCAGIGNGSVFIVTLPLLAFQASLSSNSIPISEKDDRLLKGVKILVVEDDQDSREVLKLFLA